MTLSTSSTTRMATTIESLWIYPVKSLAGIALTHCEITPQGLKGDRQWMVIDDQGLFVSQRKLPIMGLIKTKLAPDNTLTLSINDQPNDQQNSQPSAASFTQAATVNTSISLHPDECVTPCSTWVWKDECPALEAPAPVNAWLNALLQYKKPIRLVYFDKTGHRPPDSARFGDNTAFFADAAPILLCNSTSLTALNSALHSRDIMEINMQRFRPNIVVATQTAFDEHTYTRGSIESYLSTQAHTQITPDAIPNTTPNTTAVKLQLIDHCQRCSMITLNPQTAKSQNAAVLFECLSALNSMPDNPKAPAFGVNCTADLNRQASAVIIKQGAIVTLTR